MQHLRNEMCGARDHASRCAEIWIGLDKDVRSMYIMISKMEKEVHVRSYDECLIDWISGMVGQYWISPNTLERTCEDILMKFVAALRAKEEVKELGNT